MFDDKFIEVISRYWEMYFVPGSIIVVGESMICLFGLDGYWLLMVFQLHHDGMEA